MNINIVTGAIALIVNAFFMSATTSLSAQAPTGAYEALIQDVQEAYPDHPIVLNNTIANIECMPRGGCDDPWAGMFDRSWLVDLRSRGVIGDFCTSFGSCRGTDGPRPPWAVQLLLSTHKVCDASTIEINANLMVPDRADSSVRGYYWRYSLVESPDGWSIVSKTRLGDSFINE